MIPDKIYIPDNIDLVAAAVLTHGQEGDVAYIRKDALVKWLQQGFDWAKNPVISVQQIIDKLNSL